jgi:hypothetical protein
VAIDNVTITDSNRGIAFMVFDGGVVEDVVISNVTIDTKRFDWFWWGDGDPLHFNIKRRSEVDGTKRDHEPAAGKIRNVTIQNVIAHGTGASVINGHPTSWLEGVRLNNIKLFVSSDPAAPYEHTATALTVRQARGLRMSNVEIDWEKPFASTWRNGLSLDQVKDAILDRVEVHPAPGSKSPRIVSTDAEFTVWPK